MEVHRFCSKSYVYLGCSTQQQAIQQGLEYTTQVPPDGISDIDYMDNMYWDPEQQIWYVKHTQ